MVDFLTACKDVLENDVEYGRKGSTVGMRLLGSGSSFNRIEFFRFHDNKTSELEFQYVNKYYVISDWTLIKKKEDFSYTPSIMFVEVDERRR